MSRENRMRMVPDGGPARRDGHWLVGAGAERARRAGYTTWMVVPLNGDWEEKGEAGLPRRARAGRGSAWVGWGVVSARGSGRAREDQARGGGRWQTRRRTSTGRISR